MGEARSVVFLNRFYWPDVAATGQMLTDLAEDLATAGWRVTVIASRTAYAVGRAARPARECRNGVNIVRVATTRFGRSWLAGRAADYASYVPGAMWRLLRLPCPDVVVAMTDPPLLAAPALLAGRLRGFRTVCWLQDLYPELAVRLRVFREKGPAHRLTTAVAKRVYNLCDSVVALGPRMALAAVEAGARQDRTSWVHNWADARAVRPVPPEANPFLDEHALRGRFVVLYSGNAGLAHTFEGVLGAARRLRGDSEVVFVFIGGGRKVPEIRAAVRRSDLPNVRILDYLPRDRLPLSLSAAGASLVTEDPAAAGLLVPSKTYGILASGRPLLFVGSAESDVAAIVRDTGCGLVVAPEDPDGVVAAIQRIRANPAEAAEMGVRGRRAAESLYDRRIATRRWAETLTRILDDGAGEVASRAVPAYLGSDTDSSHWTGAGRFHARSPSSAR